MCYGMGSCGPEMQGEPSTEQVHELKQICDIHSHLPVSSRQAARRPDDFSTFLANFSTASTAIPLT